MKVLSYLELNEIIEYGAIEDEIYEFYCKRIGENYSQDGINTLNMVDFYSQPFKPELITELFDIIGHYHIFKGRGKGYYELWNDNNQHIYRFPLPRTLDDFITDCQRAGIELNLEEK